MLSDRMASIGTLAAGVAHEINNPLTYVLTNLHILAKRADRALGLHDAEQARELMCTEDTLQLLRETSEGARRVRDIARDLKTFSRSSDEVQPVDVRQVLDSSVRMAINEIRHRARLERNYMDTPQVLANSSRLGQVFLNLIVNAAQAIPEGASDRNVIRLTTWAEVAVTDTGTGIPHDLLDRIFEPFVTMKPVGVGTGLGLYICRDIVANLGGMIEVESQMGVGTTFKVCLPPAPSDAVDRAAAPRTKKQPETALPRAKILVIDDEVNIGQSLARSLEDHDVTLVTSGREAIDRLDGGAQFDLIFCDVMMPELTGRDVFEHIEARHPAYLAKIVFMTGGAFTERAAEFVEHVRARKIDKPFDIGLIRAILREFLDPQHRARIPQLGSSSSPS
jgi:CheY-like chemotaxis protein/two-component sensor histidine kinase